MTNSSYPLYFERVRIHSRSGWEVVGRSWAKHAKRLQTFLIGHPRTNCWERCELMEDLFNFTSNALTHSIVVGNAAGKYRVVSFRLHVKCPRQPSDPSGPPPLHAGSGGSPSPLQHANIVAPPMALLDIYKSFAIYLSSLHTTQLTSYDHHLRPPVTTTSYDNCLLVTCTNIEHSAPQRPLSPVQHHHQQWKPESQHQISRHLPPQSW